MSSRACLSATPDAVVTRIKVLSAISSVTRSLEQDARQSGCLEVAHLLATTGHAAQMAISDLDPLTQDQGSTTS